MNKILESAVVLLEASDAGQLFNDGQVSDNLRAIACSEYISRDVFYGRCLGFQVRQPHPMQQHLQVFCSQYTILLLWQAYHHMLVHPLLINVHVQCIYGNSAHVHTTPICSIPVQQDQ